MIRYGSVCSGIEAASVAWHPMGWRADWLAEIEPFPSAVLAHHYPDVPNLGDMTWLGVKVLTGEVEAPDVLVGGTPCFTAGHMVLTARGYVPIEEIAVGDMVVTHEGRLRCVMRVGSKSARVGRLSGVGIGEEIVCTPDHPFRSVAWHMQNTKRGNQYARVEHIGEPEWLAAKDMPNSQWCALTSVSIIAPSLPAGIDAEELLYIAGFYLGDGFIRRWTGQNKKAVVFGVNPNKLEKFNLRVTQNVSVMRERTGPRIVMCNTAIADWLIKNFGEFSHEKTLPAWVLAHPQRAALMDGYFDTDGHRTTNGWRAISVSCALAHGMRDLVQTLGMVASVTFTKVELTKVIEGRTVNQRDYWTVTAFVGETSRKSRVRHGMLLRTVSAFEETGDETVFNIEVEGDHSYVLNGTIVHNCQAFSVAGLREGLADARGQLTIKYVELADAIDFIRQRRGQEPAVIVWENVPGVLSSKDNAFGCFLAGLAGENCELQPPRGKWPNAGCVLGPKRTIAWRVLDAQYFGLAQRRRRVFVVASARKGFDPAAVLFEFDGVRRDSAPSREAGQAVAALTANGVGTCGADDNQGQAGHLVPMAFSCKDYGTDASANLAPTLRAMGHSSSHANAGGQLAVCVTGDVTHTLKAEGFDASEDGTGRGQPIVPTHSVTIRGRDGGGTAELGDDLAGCLRASTGGGDKPHALINQSVRRLMPAECERLQGFSDGYTLVPYRGKPAADGPRYKALGNSMAVPCMAWIGRRIDAVIGKSAKEFAA